MDEKNIDIAMPWFVFQDDPLEEAIVDHLAAFQKKEETLLCGGNGGPYTEKMIKLIEKHNVPVYQTSGLGLQQHHHSINEEKFLKNR